MAARSAWSSMTLNAPDRRWLLPCRKKRLVRQPASRRRIFPQRLRGRLRRVIWWRRGARGNRRCTFSICKEKCCWARLAISRIFRRAWRGPAREIISRRHLQAEKARACGCGRPERAQLPFAQSPTKEMGVPDGFERQTYEAEFGEEGAFGGYGRTAFSPDEKILASVIEIRGDWADDSIVLADVPALRTQNVFQAQGHITDLTWTPDSRQIIYCAAGQAYSLDVESLAFEPLPFGAELCVCHPHLPLCICYSSWLKNSAKGRLFIVDLGRQTMFDEYAAEGIVDLRWSVDGSKAYAMTQDGMAYIYEPPLI